MRSFGTAALLLALTAAPVLAGCGSDAGDADDVPTITTRPSRHHPTRATDAPPSPSTPTASASESVEASPPVASVTTESGPSPEPPTDAPGGPSSYDEARERIESRSTGEPAFLARFSTAGDVVYCLLDDPVIGPACELRTGFVKDAEVCGGDVADGVGRIETYRGRARPVCNTDTIREPGADEVADGSVVVSGDVECLVEAIGVTCTDAGAHLGFFIGPREYHVF